MSYAPISGPGRMANEPSGLRGQLCMPYTARIGNLSNSPSSTITRPPPSFSSAGWKMKYTVPSKRRRRASALAAPEQHRRVSVVAAGVHPAFVRRRVGDARAFGDVQRVHVGAQADRVVAASAAKHADDAGLGEPGMHVQADRFELVDDERARRRFLERRFGVRVDMMPPIAHLGVERGNFGHDVHRVSHGKIQDARS